jgi:hypothetical protein
MEFPATWVVLNITDYDTAMPAVPGEFVVELLAQLRNTGRVLDGFRFALDGSRALEATVNLDQILPSEELKGLQALFQCWPRDVKIRRNMLSTAWTSLTDSLSSNELDITDEDGGGVTPGAVMRILERLPGNGPVNASTRWAISAGSDGFLSLQLQSLPLVASVLNNRSTFKRYATRYHPPKLSGNKTFSQSSSDSISIVTSSRTRAGQRSPGRAEGSKY